VYETLVEGRVLGTAYWHEPKSSEQLVKASGIFEYMFSKKSNLALLFTHTFYRSNVTCETQKSQIVSNHSFFSKMWKLIKRNSQTMILIWLCLLIALAVRTISVYYGRCDDFFVAKIEIVALIPLLLFNLFYFRKVKPETQFWVFYVVALLHLYLRVLVVEMNVPDSDGPLHFPVCIILIYTQVFIVGEFYVFLSKVIFEILLGKNKLNPEMERLIFLSKILLFYGYVGWSFYGMAFQGLIYCTLLGQPFSWNDMLRLSFVHFGAEHYPIWQPFKELWEFLSPKSVSCAGDEKYSTHFPPTPAEQKTVIHEGELRLSYEISELKESALPAKAILHHCTDPCASARKIFRDFGWEAELASRKCEVQCITIKEDLSVEQSKLPPNSLEGAHIQTDCVPSKVVDVLKASNAASLSFPKQVLANRILDKEIPKIFGQEEAVRVRTQFYESKENCIIS